MDERENEMKESWNFFKAKNFILHMIKHSQRFETFCAGNILFE